jgi:hypothetical protein
MQNKIKLLKLLAIVPHLQRRQSIFWVHWWQHLHPEIRQLYNKHPTHRYRLKHYISAGNIFQLNSFPLPEIGNRVPDAV